MKKIQQILPQQKTMRYGTKIIKRNFFSINNWYQSTKDSKITKMDNLEKSKISNEKSRKLKLQQILNKIQREKLELESKINILQKKIRKLENECKQN